MDNNNFTNDMKIHKIIIGLISIFLLVNSSASDPPDIVGTISMRAGEVIKAVYCFFFSITTAVASALIVISGITWISSMGDTEKIYQAKMRIIWSLIAMILITIACPLINILAQAAGATPVDCACF